MRKAKHLTAVMADMLPCSVAPLSGFEHLLTPERPGNEDRSHLTNFLKARVRLKRMLHLKRMLGF